MSRTEYLIGGVAIGLLVGAVVVTVAGGFLGAPTADGPGQGGSTLSWIGAGDGPSVETFESADEFREYVDRAADRSDSIAFVGGRTGTTAGDAAESLDADTAAARSEDDGGVDGSETGGPDRHSGTNVQVEGIDEPDLVKTDGTSLYYAGAYPHHRIGVQAIDSREEVEASDDRGTAARDTHVIDVADPADPAVVAGIPESGQLLLDDGTLLVLDGNAIHGFDVSDPADPERTWETELDGHLETARLLDGDVYLVIVDRVDRDAPCPVRPLDGADVACTDVYHAPGSADGDATFSVVRLDPASGAVEDATSFVGSARNTVTYVSEDGVYLTYQRSASFADVQLEFLLGDGRDALDERAVTDLERLQSYELSERARLAEIDAIMRAWSSRLDEDERVDAQERISEDFEEYARENLREFERTGVVKVDVGGPMTVAAVGEVPGRPLNQFSLDEHEGYLRIATTVSAPYAESENDLYVLDEDLETVGSVQGMGVDERIYSVRYVGDEAYVVTFREVDPFHTIDLTDPENPEVLGELKLPGFSTYLHPLSEDRVLGIGQEDRQVKAVIFDVTDRENPVVLDDAILSDRWSAIDSSHHAFLLDERHGVFFLPTEQGGYVFSYEDGLEEEAFVDTEGSALRAAYFDDYLYVFGENEVVVLDQTSWEEVRRLEL